MTKFMCRLLESIRVEDGRFCHIGYHQARMDRTMRILLPESEPIDLSAIPIPDDAGSGIYKCRVVYHEGVSFIEFLPYTQKRIRSIRLVQADGLRYPFKYLDRSGIESLLAANVEYDEILIVRDGLITDSSFSNVALLSGRIWFTPETPLLEGTCRQRLVDLGVLHPIRIGVQDIRQYSHISLINAMMGLGEMVLPIKSLE